MARGKSGKVVIEIDPDVKHQLYSVLATKNQTLKDWFLEATSVYLTSLEETHVPETDNPKPSMKEKS